MIRAPPSSDFWFNHKNQKFGGKQIQKWQKERNYKKIELSENKEKCIIFIDGAEIEVSKEVFDAYSKADRRERYQEEARLSHLHVSLEKLAEEDVPVDLYLQSHSPSPESILIEEENSNIRQELIARLSSVIELLTDKEQHIIKALFYNGHSIREVANEYGVFPNAIIYQRDRILEKLKKHLQKFWFFIVQSHIFSGMEWGGYSRSLHKNTEAIFGEQFSSLNIDN